MQVANGLRAVRAGLVQVFMLSAVGALFGRSRSRLRWFVNVTNVTRLSGDAVTATIEPVSWDDVTYDVTLFDQRTNVTWIIIAHWLIFY
jgi:hypothetical protein